MRFSWLLLVLVGSCGGTTSAALVWKGEPPPTGAWLNGVWASGDHDVYAVGLNGTMIHSKNDGSPWVLESLPAPVQQAQTALWGVGGSSATDVYAVGDNGLILHGAGDGQWSEEPSPVNVTLHHVWANSALDVFIVGDGGTILHGDGSGAWVPQASGTTDRLWSTWASGPGDIYAVGGKSGLTTSDSPAESLMLHSTDGGSTWKPVALPAGGKDLEAVWGASSANVVAVGWNHIYRSTDGATWLEVPNTSAIGLDALAGDGTHLYTAGNGLVLGSDDGAASWHQVLGGFGVTGAWVTPNGDCYIVGVGSDGNGGPNVGAIGHGA